MNPSIRAHGSLINNHRCKPRRNKILGGFERLEVRRLLADWFAAPTGVATNAGTFDSPWDLTTALNNVNVIDPGDTLFLRGGAYRHPDRSHGSTGYGFHLDGAEGAPVTVRPYFDEHAIIDGGLHVSQGTSSQYLTITGLEVIVSENVTGNRTSTISGSSYPADLNRPAGGVEITSGYAIKFVNNVVRDNAQGITFSRSVGGNSELHGNIIYDNGWLGPDRPHGPAFYAQNGADGWKYITDNLAFDNYTRTLQAYGSANTSVDRFYIARNIFFDDVPSSKHDALVGGEAPIHDILVENNVAYGVDIRLGWVDGGDGIVVRNNNVRGEIEYKEFSEITTNNNWEWGLTDAQPTVDGVPVAVPASPRVFFNVNAYDSRRANLAIMNHLGATQVLVNPGTFLKSGDTYRIMDPTNLWGAPITSGVYNGGSLNVPTPGPFAAYVVFASSGPTNTPPTISDFAHVSLNVGETVPLCTFTIADAQTAASALVVTATSSNPALVPSTGLILGGSGANRNLSVRPTTGATGFSDITVTVRDAGGLTKSDVFRVTVTDPSVNTPPTMTNLTNVTTLVGESIPLRSFVVSDVQTAPGALSVAVASSNLALVPSSGLVLGGSGANRTLKITPAPNATGVTTISVWVRDAAGLLAKDIFRVTVQPTANNTAPSVTDLSNITALVGDSIPVRPFTVGDAETPAGSLTVTVSSSNLNLVPVSGLVLGGSGANRNLSVRPTAGATGFSDITVTVRDTGGLTRSDVFRVTVSNPIANTPPTMTSLTNITTLVGELIPLRSFVVGDAETAPGSLSVQVASSNLALVPSSGLVLGGSGANRTLKITPAPNATGVTTISVWVRDAAGLLAKDIFRVTVQPTANNTAPSVTDLSNITALVGDSIPMRPFTVGDAETPAGSLSVTGSSSNPSLAPTSGLVLGGGGANRTLKITPTPNMTGDASISIWVRDAQGNLAKDVFRVYVNPLTAIAPMTSPNLADQSSPVTSTRNMIWADSEAAHAFDALLLARATKRTMQSENGAREALWFATLNKGTSVSRTALTEAIDSIFEEQSAAAP